ncbi:MAG: 4-hydroxy-3-methylbut-2-enyl diphosphate reductase [Pseudomonadales bacterium]
MTIEAFDFEIRLANPRGFCAGVDRAIEIVNRALEIYGSPVYVRHEVVHNKHVVEDLSERGAVFVDEVSEIPEGALCIFSAHGVSQQVRRDAEARGLRVFDATCPLVTKVHMEVAKAAAEHRDAVLIGHEGHPEVEGTLGQFENGAKGQKFLVETVEDAERLIVRDASKLSFMTQTTLSVDDTREIIHVLQRRFPDIQGPRKDDICYATQNRQDAVKALAALSEVVIVVGSQNSSNSNRLRELAERLGADAYLIDHFSQIEPQWLDGKRAVGVTSGASAPEVLVQSVVDFLMQCGGRLIEMAPTAEEEVEFSLPKALR